MLSPSFTPRDSDKSEVKIFPLKILSNIGILLSDSRSQMVAGTRYNTSTCALPNSCLGTHKEIGKTQKCTKLRFYL